MKAETMTNQIKSPSNQKPIARKDIQQIVTDKIIAQLQQGVVPWQKPWTGTENSLPQLPINFTTNKRYRNVNIILLWSSALEKNYQSNEWASLKQWNSKGEKVTLNEKGTMITYYDTVEREKEDGEKQKVPFLKVSHVFNREQLAGYVAPVLSEPIKNPATLERIEQVEKFVADTKAVINQHNDGACYIPSQDKIMMPHAEHFIDTDNCTATEGFYSVLLHELTHWSGSEKRLNRIKNKKFGDENYATEELVAEFGAAFLCAGFGIRTLEKGNHAAYIDFWLKVLKENKQCLFTAATEATKAVDYLHSLTIA